MSSWKKYGGIDNFDKSNHITVNSIVADYFTIKKQFIGDFDICGNVIVGKQLVVDGVAIINGIMRTRSIDMSGNLAVNNIDCSYNGRFNNMEVNNDLKMSNSQFIYGDVSGIGINNRNPKATLDISGNNMSSINVYTSNSINRNVLAHNGNHNGVAIWSDNTTSYIDFFVNTDISINNTSFDGRIQYDQGGNLLLDADKYVNILPQLVISDLSSDVVYNNSIVTIHGDNSSNVFNYDSYNNANVFVQNAITTVAKDNSSVMFINLIKPDKNGFSIAGGNCPYDSTRTLGAIGFNDLSTHTFNANQTIISGNSTIKYKTTTGINTYKPLVDKYVLDINGPVHIKNGENNIVAKSRTLINYMKFNKENKNIGVAACNSDGSYNIPLFYTNDGGKTWIVQNLYTVQTNDSNFQIRTLFVYDASYTFVIGDNLNGFYTYNGGINWRYFNINFGATPKSMYISNIANNIVRFFLTLYIRPQGGGSDVVSDELYYFDAYIGVTNVANNVNYFNADSYRIVTSISSRTLENTANTSVIDGYGNFLYIAGNNGIYKYTINNVSQTANVVHYITILNNRAKYNAIHVFDNSYVLAAGDGVLSYSTTGGNSWNDFGIGDFTYFHPQWYKFTSVNIFDLSTAIAVSDDGKIAYTNDGITWKDASASTFFNLSGSEKMLDGSLNHVTIVNKDSFILTNTNNQNIDYNTNIVYNYFPDLFNHIDNNVLDISGNMNIYGNITIVPDNTNTIIISSNAGTCNFLNDVTSLNIGKANSLTTFNGGLTVKGALDATQITFSNTLLAYLIIDPTTDLNFISKNVTYALDISGGSVKIDNLLNVFGNVSFSNVAKKFEVNSTSIFYNNATFYKGIDISVNGANALSINGNAQVNGSVVVFNPNKSMDTTSDNNGAFFVNGHTKINKDLLVMRNITIAGSANSDYSLYVGTGNIFLNTDLRFVNGKLYVNADASFHRYVYMNNGARVNGEFIIQSGSSNKLIVNSDASFTGDVYIGTTKISSDGTFVVNKYASFNGNIFVNKDASFNGNIYFGNSIINRYGTLTMNRDASFNGNVFVNGTSIVFNSDASFNGNMCFGNSIINRDGTLSMNRDSSFNGITFFNNNVSCYNRVSFGQQTNSYYSYFDNSGVFNTSKGIILGQLSATLDSNSNGSILELRGSAGAEIRFFASTSFYSPVIFPNDYEANFYGSVKFNTASSPQFLGTVLFNNPAYDTTFKGNVIFDNSGTGINTRFNGRASFNNVVESVLGFGTGSDYRIKSNISKLTDTSFTIDALNPVFYYNEKSSKNDIGFIAHELQEHFPFLVNGEKDGESLQSVNYTGLIGVLVKEIQILKEKVKKLEIGS